MTGTLNCRFKRNGSLEGEKSLFQEAPPFSWKCSVSSIYILCASKRKSFCYLRRRDLEVPECQWHCHPMSSDVTPSVLLSTIVCGYWYLYSLWSLLSDADCFGPAVLSASLSFFLFFFFFPKLMGWRYADVQAARWLPEGRCVEEERNRWTRLRGERFQLQSKWGSKRNEKASVSICEDFLND